MMRSSLSAIYILIRIYIYLQTQSGDRAISQSHTVQHPHMGSNFEYNQYALLNLSMGDKNNDAVIVNTK